MAAQEWLPPPIQAPLAEGEVHVWRVRVDDAPSWLPALWPLLSEEERERAERFRFERDRGQFVAAHGALRLILGGYVGMEPQALRLARGAYGKPELDAGQGADVCFNLSHARGMALLAFAYGRQVGIDVEPLRDDVGHELAERFFAPGEVAALYALPPEERQRAFFRCWTRKEAYIKARGEGLYCPLDRFEVSLAPQEPARLLMSAEGAQEVERWWMEDLYPAPGYMAALAVEGRPARLLQWDWTPQWLEGSPVGAAGYGGVQGGVADD